MKRRRFADIGAFLVLLMTCAGCAARKPPTIPSLDPSIEARPPALAEEQVANTCDYGFVERVFQNVKRSEDNLGKYEFDLTYGSIDLKDGSPGQVKRSRTFHVHYVQRQPVLEKIAEDGQPLSRKDRQQEEKHVREQLKKYKHLDTPLFVRATAYAAGFTLVPPLSFLLRRYEVLSCHEAKDTTGRELVVLELGRVADSYDAFHLPLPRRGAVLVLKDAEQVIKASIISSEEFLGGTLGRLSEWGLVYQFTKVGDDWVPARIDHLWYGSLAFFHLRDMMSYIFDNFRPVDSPAGSQPSSNTQ